VRRACRLGWRGSAGALPVEYCGSVFHGELVWVGRNRMFVGCRANRQNVKSMSPPARKASTGDTVAIRRYLFRQCSLRTLQREQEKRSLRYAPEPAPAMLQQHSLCVADVLSPLRYSFPRSASCAYAETRMFGRAFHCAKTKHRPPHRLRMARGL